MGIRLVERVAFEGAVNAETMTFNDVAVLGKVSLNGRTYSDTALDQAVTLFEGVKSFVDHHDGPPPVPRLFGRLSGLYRDGDIVKAKTLQCLNAKWWYLSEIIAKDPLAFGLSIVADGEVDQQGVVTQLTAAFSVDLVSDPATNKGLFEEKNLPESVDYTALTLDDLTKNRPDLVKAIVAPIVDQIRQALSTILPDEPSSDTPPAETAQQQEIAKENRILKLALKKGIALTEVQLKAAKGLSESELEQFLSEVGTPTHILNENRQSTLTLDSLRSSD